MNASDERSLQLRMAMRLTLDAFVALPTDERLSHLIDLMLAFQQHEEELQARASGREQLELPLAG
jgi:hypothetical protein